MPKLTAEVFKGSPIEVEYKRLSPTPRQRRGMDKHRTVGNGTLRIRYSTLDGPARNLRLAALIARW